MTPLISGVVEAKLAADVDDSARDDPAVVERARRTDLERRLVADTHDPSRISRV
jgi:hypothetical protein